jgi:prepilin-type N-terminal cleavage/methylation domain-containing protein
MLKKPAFTLIEVIAATVILGIVTTLASVSYTDYRSRSNDSRKKEDVNTILTAVVQYGNLYGNTLITYKTAAAQPTCRIIGSQTIPGNDAPDATCTGAAGRGFGKVNFKNGQEGDPNTSTQYTYPSSRTINEALVSWGVLSSPVFDPTRKNKVASNVATDPDYVLIRACPNGQQHIGSRGSTVVVWTLLSRGLEPTNNDRDSISKLAGYPFQTNIANIPEDETTYHYEFAAAAFDQEFAGATRESAVKLYGVGNSINPKVGESSENTQIGSTTTDCQI